MSQTKLADARFTRATDLSPGQAGDITVPEEYRTMHGWELKTHDHDLNEVDKFWGFNGVDGFIEWEGERFGAPINNVALVGEQKNSEKMHWVLKRANRFGTANLVKKHPETSAKELVCENGLEAALEAAKEWMETNPTGLARSTWVRKNIESDDIHERFEHYFGKAVDQDMEYINSVAAVVEPGEDLPGGEEKQDLTESVVSAESGDGKQIRFELEEECIVVDGRLVDAARFVAELESLEEIVENAVVTAENWNLVVFPPNAPEGYMIMVAPRLNASE